MKIAIIATIALLAVTAGVVAWKMSDTKDTCSTNAKPDCATCEQNTAQPTTIPTTSTPPTTAQPITVPPTSTPPTTNQPTTETPKAAAFKIKIEYCTS